MVERLSTFDQSFFSSYADHILRYKFATEYCLGKRVLDAGCGIGYGAAYLAKQGAAQVLGIDLSEEALAEANKLFQLPNLSFARHDVQNIDTLGREFDVIVNFENLEHIPHPEQLISNASRLLSEGTFITSTPNGALSTFGVDGKLSNQFHLKEFTIEELDALLGAHFKSIKLYGQWLTPTGKLRKIRAQEAFDYLNEIYYHPFSRLWRLARTAMGKKCLPVPEYNGEADSMDGDYEIRMLEEEPFPWEPSILLAVCSNPAKEK